jgi:hypothetical protein
MKIIPPSKKNGYKQQQTIDIVRNIIQNCVKEFWFATELRIRFMLLSVCDRNCEY